MGPNVQYASEKKWEPLEIRIYEGADGDFTLYEDEGDGYQYESGAYSTIRFSWNSAEKTLTMGDRTGSFPGMPEEREFNLVLIPKDQPVDREQPLQKGIRYLGEKMTVSIGKD
jgi:alpha-D-xyloside xylohydrolase